MQIIVFTIVYLNKLSPFQSLEILGNSIIFYLLQIHSYLIVSPYFLECPIMYSPEIIDKKCEHYTKLQSCFETRLLSNSLMWTALQGRNSNDPGWVKVGWQEEGRKAAWPQMALEPKRRENWLPRRVIFPVASTPTSSSLSCEYSWILHHRTWLCFLRDFPPHLSINYRFGHESETDDSHYLLGWVHVCMYVFEKPPAVHS